MYACYNAYASLHNIHMCIVYTYIQIYIVYTQTHIQDYKHTQCRSIFARTSLLLYVDFEAL